MRRDLDKFASKRQELADRFHAGEISEQERDDALRVLNAEEAQATMLAALPEFPRFGFYVKTGLAGYGPDLDENDMPNTSWENVADTIADELRQMAEFNSEGASATAEQARAYYAEYQRGNEGVVQAADLYHEAWQAHTLAGDLAILAENFANLAKTENVAPLYEGRPELRHACIWDLITGKFPLDVSHNSRLYVWECEEDPYTHYGKHRSLCGAKFREDLGINGNFTEEIDSITCPQCIDMVHAD